VWLPYYAPLPPTTSQVTLTLTAPDGTVSDPLTETVGTAVTLPKVSVHPYAVAQYDFDLRGTRRSCFQIVINPTARLLGRRRMHIAPSGLWTITLHSTGGLSPQAPIEAWVQRDDLLYGYPRRGRQAYFDDPKYARYDQQGRPLYDDPAPLNPSYVLRNGMINGIGTGRSPVVAGGFVAKTLAADTFSTGGPCGGAYGGPRTVASPDLLMPSDGSRAHAGILAAGSRSGSVVALSGTSMSCAQLTRLCADRIASGTFPNHTVVQAAVTVLPGGPNRPPARSGAGCTAPPVPTNGWETRFWS
jgi:hypothetical protein